MNNLYAQPVQIEPIKFIFFFCVKILSKWRLKFHFQIDYLLLMNFSLTMLKLKLANMNPGSKTKDSSNAFSASWYCPISSYARPL